MQCCQLFANRNVCNTDFMQMKFENSIKMMKTVKQIKHAYKIYALLPVYPVKYKKE